MGRTLNLKVPDVFLPVFLADPEPRYIVLEGGRGGGRSTTVADKLLLKGLDRPRRVLCAREIQKSIEDSVHQLLADEIDRLDLGYHYEVLKSEIRERNTEHGTRFIYSGIRNNPSSVKSMQGVTDLWIEEAEGVRDRSLDIVLPTVRGCVDPQVFLTFNPYSENDPVYKRFVTDPPPNTLHIHSNYDDNPWFPGFLREQMEHDKATDYALYLHKWCGMTIEKAGTTEFPMDSIQTWHADRFDQKNWYLLVDPSGSKKKVDGDYTVMSPCGLGVDRNYYFGHWVRDKMDLLEKYNTMVRLHEQYRFRAIGYEDSNGGTDINFFALKGDETGYRLPIIPLKARVADLNKVDRMRWLVPLAKERRMIVPQTSMYQQLDGKVIDLTQAFYKEARSFPHISSGTHDDMLDAMSRILDPDLAAVFPSAGRREIGPERSNRRYDPATGGFVERKSDRPSPHTNPMFSGRP